jgi:hypothetical protein
MYGRIDVFHVDVSHGYGGGSSRHSSRTDVRGHSRAAVAQPKHAPPAATAGQS